MARAPFVRQKYRTTRSAVFHNVLALISRFGAQHREEDQLCRERGSGVEKHVAEGAGPRWQKALMPFVQTRDQCRAEYSNRRPLQAPLSAEAWKSPTPRAKK